MARRAARRAARDLPAGAPKPGSKASKKAAGAGRAAVDFTKRNHAGEGLPVPAPRLKTHYENVVRGVLAEQFGLKNIARDPDAREDRGELRCR